jgi:SPP1 family predicted phage head-tail adaptor
MSRKPHRSIGHLRKKLTFLEPQRAIDGLGGAIETWQPYLQLWGAVVAITGRELDQHDRRSGVISYAITVRRNDDIKPKHVIWCGNRSFHIEAIIEPDVKRRRMVCLVSERDL